MAKAFYPGSFDPAHNGHIDVATRASALFDEVIVGVYEAPPSKNLMFTTDERVALFQKAIPVSNVSVVPFTGLALNSDTNTFYTVHTYPERGISITSRTVIVLPVLSITT